LHQRSKADEWWLLWARTAGLLRGCCANRLTRASTKKSCGTTFVRSRPSMVAGALAVEWHVHAWDLGQSINFTYRPAAPERLVDAFKDGMAYLYLPSSYEDPWEAILSAAGRTIRRNPVIGR
jgi:hypothetical protein